MNYYKEAESILNSLPELEKALINLNRRYQRLIESGAPKDIGAIDYSKPFVSSHNVRDTLEDMLELVECGRNIEKTKSKIESIMDVIAQLDAEEKKLVELWYIKKRTKEDIAEAFDIALTTVYNIRNKAVSHFAVLYFGYDALASV